MNKLIKPWTPAELKLHQQAVQKLECILKQSATHIAHSKPITEEQLYQFIVNKMTHAGITSVLNWTIVAYGASAADPHYHFKHGKSRVIKHGQLLLIDIWGKLNRPDAPYADITQMYYIGKRPSAHFQKIWYDIRSTRDLALAYIQQHPGVQGQAIHNLAQKHLDSCGHSGLFLHGLGHDLGHDTPHGPGANLNSKSTQPLIPGRGYTIEPGIYKKGSFGVRSEIDFFLNRNHKVQITTKVQKNLQCISHHKLF